MSIIFFLRGFLNKYFILTITLLIEITAFGIDTSLIPELKKEPASNCSEDFRFKGDHRGCFVYNRKMPKNYSWSNNCSVFSNEGLLSLNFTHQPKIYINEGSPRMALERIKLLDLFIRNTPINSMENFRTTSKLYQWNYANEGIGAVSLTEKYALGLLLINEGKIFFKAEAHFIDKKVMTIMGEFRF